MGCLNFFDFLDFFGLKWTSVVNLGLSRMRMEINGRVLPPSIPEDGEVPDHLPPGEVNGHHRRFRGGDGGEAELPVSKSQRRKSDVKVYKEFCDFYARL